MRRRMTLGCGTRCSEHLDIHTITKSLYLMATQEALLQVFLLDRLTIRSVCWRFYGLFWNFVDREGQKKRGVFVAQQGAFCKQPLLFQHLCLSYVFSHRFTLSLRNGRAPYLWQSVILHFFEFFFRKIHRGHLRYGFICSRETKNGRTMLCGIVRPLADADRKTVLL